MADLGRPEAGCQQKGIAGSGKALVAAEEQPSIHVACALARQLGACGLFRCKYLVCCSRLEALVFGDGHEAAVHERRAAVSWLRQWIPGAAATRPRIQATGVSTGFAASRLFASP
jgi:hypothetical protein